jgi:hypothetical protein
MRFVAGSLLGLALLGFACSSSPNAQPTGSAGVCGDGYLPAVNGACPKGTCLASGTSAACCGSQCATCEDKGLVSIDEAGACPPGLCISADLTVSLTCCDVCPGTVVEAGASDASDASNVSDAGSTPDVASDATAD